MATLTIMRQRFVPLAHSARLSTIADQWLQDALSALHLVEPTIGDRIDPVQ